MDGQVVPVLDDTREKMMLLKRAELLECAGWEVERFKIAARRDQLPLSVEGVYSEQFEPELAEIEEQHGYRRYSAIDVLCLVLVDHLTREDGIRVKLAADIVGNCRPELRSRISDLATNGPAKIDPAKEVWIGAIGDVDQRSTLGKYHVGGKLADIVASIHEKHLAWLQDPPEVPPYRILLANASLAYRQARQRAATSKTAQLLSNFDSAYARDREIHG